MAEHISSGKGLKELKKLRLMKPRTERAVTAAANLLLQAGVITGASAAGVSADKDTLAIDAKGHVYRR